jgi:hypothetical protein
MKEEKGKYNLPEGWTETKTSDNTKLLNIPEEQLQNWEKKRHLKDKMSKLIKKDGIYMKPHGRIGSIYFVNEGRLCEIEYELSGTNQFDLLVFLDGTKEWILPTRELIKENEKEVIKEQIIHWLGQKKIRTDLK